jgi:hypothetical protein
VAEAPPSAIAPPGRPGPAFDGGFHRFVVEVEGGQGVRPWRRRACKAREWRAGLESGNGGGKGGGGGGGCHQNDVPPGMCHAESDAPLPNSGGELLPWLLF